MTLVLSRPLQKAMFAHVASTYPDEGCGFLVGSFGPERRVARVKPAPNTVEGHRRTRFVIHPRELLAMEDEAEAAGHEILGFYHSHPDYPAAPSRFDEEHAWPTYSYIVISVMDAKPLHLTSWILEPDRSGFVEEPVVVR